MDGLFPLIFHGERSELREKYGLGVNNTVGKMRDQSGSIVSVL
jgi:hypothetical protein